MGNDLDSEYREMTDRLFKGSTVNFHHDAITGTHTALMEAGNLDLMNELYSKNADGLARRINDIAVLQGLHLTKPEDLSHCHNQFDHSFASSKRLAYSQDTRVLCLEEAPPSYRNIVTALDDYFLDGQPHEYILAVTNPSTHYRQGFSFRTALSFLELQ